MQKHIVDRINDPKLTVMDNWQKLKELRLYSQERRRERYQVIFLWKICQGQVSGFDVNFTNTVVRSAPAIVRYARELLPDDLRSMNKEHVDMFKNHIYVFLSSIPDQPTMIGLGRAAYSNSLLH